MKSYICSESRKLGVSQSLGNVKYKGHCSFRQGATLMPLHRHAHGAMYRYTHMCICTTDQEEETVPCHRTVAVLKLGSPSAHIKCSVIYKAGWGLGDRFLEGRELEAVPFPGCHRKEEFTLA